MQLHHLIRKHPHKKKVSVGRGGKRGKTSGRGTKGQKARAGHKMRPEIRDMIKKLPKLRGHGKNRARTVVPDVLPIALVKLSALDKAFGAGDAVTPATLTEKGLVRKRGGAAPSVVKVLADGEIHKALTFSGCRVSAAARAKIEAAGGKVSIV